MMTHLIDTLNNFSTWFANLPNGIMFILIIIAFVLYGLDYAYKHNLK